MIFGMIFLCASVLIFLGGLIWIDIDLRREEKTNKEEHAKAEKLSYVLTNSAFCNSPINTAVGYVPPLKKTNADRIRSMTGEELAEFFVEIQNDVADYYDGGHAFEPDFPTNKDTWLEWLKAEVVE